MDKQLKLTKPFHISLIKRMQQYRLWIFLLISADYVLAYFHKGISAVVGPEIIKELALLPTSLGLISSAYFWAFAAMAFPAGVLSDTWGTRKTLGIFILLASIGGIVFAKTYNIELLAIGRFIIGLGSGPVYVAAMRFLTDWYKPDELATYSGLLLAAGNIGALLATTPLVFLMGSIGWRASFSLVAVLTFILGIASYLFIRNKPSDLGFPAAQDMPVTPAVSSKASLNEAVKVVLGEKKFYLLAIFIFSYYGTFMGFGSLWAGPYLQNIYSFSKTDASNILMLFPLGMIICCPLAGYLSDKIIKSRKKVLLYGCILHALSYIPLLFFTDQMTGAVLYALFFFYGLSGGAFVSCFACVKELYEKQFAGTANGALVVFVSLGGAFYQYVIALVINSYPVISPGVYSLAAYKSAFLVPLLGLIAGIAALSFFKEGLRN